MKTRLRRRVRRGGAKQRCVIARTTYPELAARRCIKGSVRANASSCPADWAMLAVAHNEWLLLLAFCV